MRSSLGFLVVLMMLAGCTATKLMLPSDPVRLTIVQRQAKAIPGSRGTIKVKLEDITGRQVLLSVRGALGQPILDTVSVRKGDVVDFELGGQRYYLKVIELKNFITGDDFGVFELSSSPPTK